MEANTKKKRKKIGKALERKGMNKRQRRKPGRENMESKYKLAYIYRGNHVHPNT